MKFNKQIVVISLFFGAISCATAPVVEKVRYTRDTSVVPGPEYEYLGKIYLGGQVLSGGGKIANSSAFGGFSEEHSISKMKDMTEDAGGNFLIVESIKETGYGDQIRYFGVGKAYRLRESFGTIGKKNLTEKGIMVQYVVRMEPGPDYSLITSAKADNGSVSGSKGEISAVADSEEEVIIVLRNTAADLGANLLVVDSTAKDESKNPAVFKGAGRIFKMKK